MSFPSLYESDANESVGFLFLKVYNTWHTEIKLALDAINLTHPQFIILTVLGYLEQSTMYITQKMVAEFSDIDVMTVSQVVTLLEKKELLSREAHPIDARAKSLNLSVKGKNILTIAIPLVEKIDTHFFSALKHDREKFIANLTTLLNSNTKQ